MIQLLILLYAWKTRRHGPHPYREHAYFLVDEVLGWMPGTYAFNWHPTDGSVWEAYHKGSPDPAARARLL